jgi:Carboxypeptidase regulatory-like domain/TonB dependent receptor-like, beta-barrel
MRSLVVGILLCAAAAVAFGQAGTGTITGTVLDPAGAVVSGAAITVKNTQTGVAYPTTSTSTGNYTVTQLPPGTYEVTVTFSGFKTYVHSNLLVQAAQIVRENPTLEVGAAEQSVTVTEQASLLKTESGELSHNVDVKSLDDLPILGIGTANAGSSGVRNPYSLTLLMPGVSYRANNTMVVNGSPNNTQAIRIEGQDMTNHLVNFAVQEEQPSADAIQEVAVQTSNFSPEYGTVGGGLFNITMKSGTNAYHGSGYDYFVNEALYAGYPYTNDGTGHKVRPLNRRNDYGGTLGGPVVIPHLYDGHNKTFFFFNWEEFLESTTLNFPLTLPTSDYRAGDFSSVSPNGGAGFNPALGVPTGALPSKDGLGRDIFANTIYDPLTRTVNPANGVAYANPFPNNIIPMARLDPIMLKVQSLFPQPSNSNVTQNGFGTNPSDRTTTIPSLKVDQSIGSKGHLSFYWSTTQTDAQYAYPYGNADGLPEEITNTRGTFIHSKIFRLNYDHTITPTLLLHLGAGYQQLNFFDDAPYLTFNAQKELGLSGFQTNRNFPYISGMCPAPPPLQTGCGGSLGGMQAVGTANQGQTHNFEEKPSYNANLTWVKGSHTFKLGGEVYFQGDISQPFGGVILAATAAGNSGATALPFNPPQGLAGQSIGFGYANFLLGDFASIQQNASIDYRQGKAQWALFAQDSWKVTRKLTLDYGLRWDYGTYAREQYGRSANLGVNVPNTNAGGRLGGTVFEATCNCRFADNYPYAVGPRIGLAYQITPNTVLRAGWGLVYGFTPDVRGSAARSLINSPGGVNDFVNIEDPNALPQPVWPLYDPALYPSVGSINSAPQALDPHAGRPPRQNQWSIGIQQQINRNLVVEATYVGNRGVWWATGTAAAGNNLGLLEQVSPATFAAYGLNPYTNVADNLLLSSAVSSSAVTSRFGYIPLPYDSYPLKGSLLNALRPYPQFAGAGTRGAPLEVVDSPTASTWYDALQFKATQRLSRGLSATATFTWSKALQNVRQDIFNPASSQKTIQATDQPFLFNVNLLYTTQNYGIDNKILSNVVKDWQIGAFLQYGSGLPLTPPSVTTANNLVQGPNYQVRVPGQPLYLKDLNCHCINPFQDQVLNPAAWTNPGNGVFGTDALWGDFRSARRPSENFNFGRNFRITERVNLQIRAEFVNIFNRTFLGNPSTSRPQSPLGKNHAGQYVSGFGVINETVATGGIPSSSQLASPPRTGTIVARFTF